MFQAPKLTDAGKALYYENMTGSKLKFTTIKLGDGTISKPIATMSDLVHAVMTIEAAVVTFNDYANVAGAFSNAPLETGFYWREIGIFVANKNDPNNRAADILYCYQNAYDTADFIPVASVETVEKNITVPVIVGDATAVSCTLTRSQIFATAKDLDEHAQNTEIHVGTEKKDTLNDADDVVVVDSDTRKAKRIAWVNVKAVLNKLFVPLGRKINGKPLSADVTLTPNDVGAAAASHGTHVTYSSVAPAMDGAASVGSAATVSRSDHRHPVDTSREPLVKNATAKTAPIDTDSVVLVDSADSSKTKRLTWVNIKAALGKVFAALVHTHPMEQITGLIAAMSNKAAVAQEIPQGADLDAYDTEGDFYGYAAGGRIAHSPIDDVISLSVRPMGAGLVHQTVKGPAASFERGQHYTADGAAKVWYGWTECATATPPQEYDLPLAAGVITKLPSVYRCNQFGEATYTLFAGTSIDVADGATIATLPVGFRPPAGRGSLFECGVIDNRGLRYGGNTITVRTDGVMVYNGIAIPAGSMFWSHGSFLAS